MIQPQKFARKPFLVDAIQVTAENMAEVAEWCGGTLQNDDPKAEGNPDAAPQYIKVDVNRAINDRQTKAFIGDHVLNLVGSGFKVYTDKAFRKSFDKAKQISKAQADAAGIRPPIERKKKGRPVPTAPKRKPENPVLTEEQAKALASPVAEPEAAEVETTVVQHRSAIDGQFVSKEEAEANPNTTVSESVIQLSD